jgi:hypothetical protein
MSFQTRLLALVYPQCCYYYTLSNARHQHKRPLGSTSILTKVCGVQNSMIVITKKWGESNESELQAMMIWKGGQMANMFKGWPQNQNAKHL